MKYSVTITPVIIDEKLTLDNEVITSADYVAGPKDEYCGIRRRNISVVVNGVLNSHETKTIEVLRWIETQDNFKAFRCEFNLEIKDNKDEVVRTVSFPNASVVEYKEIFDEQGARFSFIVRQRYCENEDVTVD